MSSSDRYKLRNGSVHARFVIVPLEANIAASFPVNLAIRSSSAIVDSSSPYTSSPREARRAYRSCGSVGTVMVSPSVEEMARWVRVGEKQGIVNQIS